MLLDQGEQHDDGELLLGDGTGMCTSALMTYITRRTPLRTYCFRGREWGRRKQTQASARTPCSASELCSNIAKAGSERVHAASVTSARTSSSMSSRKVC